MILVLELVEAYRLLLEQTATMKNEEQEKCILVKLYIFPLDFYPRCEAHQRIQHKSNET